MLRTVATSAMRAANHAAIKRTMATSSSDLLPPLRVAVTGAAGQIGYAMLMRIARYGFDNILFALLSVLDEIANGTQFEIVSSGKSL